MYKIFLLPKDAFNVFIRQSEALSVAFYYGIFLVLTQLSVGGPSQECQIGSYIKARFKEMGYFSTFLGQKLVSHKMQ